MTRSTSERGPSVTFLPEPEPRELYLPIISVDDHLMEPADTFTSRVPDRLREAVPHMESVDGNPHWNIDGRIEAVTMVNAVSGRPVDEWYSHSAVGLEHVRRGVWDPAARVRDMDVNGVWASLNFPSITWGFSGRVLSDLEDPEVGLACVKAYNDWFHEEWLSTFPDRFIGGQIPWLNDADVAAEEIRRNAARGFRSVNFTENPQSLGRPSLYSDFWDPFYAACEETGTVVNIHVGSAASIVRPSPDSPMDALVALFPLSSAMAVVDWIYAKIPSRFPDLRIALSEGGASWVPMIVERLTRAYRQCDAPASVWDPSLGHPADILRRNFWFASIEDPAAFRMLDVIGEDNVIVEVDYPHQDSSWPDTQDLLRSQIEHLPRPVAEKIAWRNAAELYRHPAPPTQDWRSA